MSRKKAAVPTLALKVQPELPPEAGIFLNTWRELTIALVNERNEIQDCALPVEVQLRYLKDDSQVADVQACVQFQPVDESAKREQGGIALTNGVAKIRFQVLKELEHRIFAFQFSVFNQPPVIVRSYPMKVVKYKPEIMQNLPPLFFKDQGGQHHCIEFRASLVDQAGRPLPRPRLEGPQKVQFGADLLYEDGVRVLNQNVLSIKTLATDPDGILTCRMRISDVSKKHLAQRFRLRIMPLPDNEDIGGVISAPVEVRSKPKKMLEGRGTKRNAGDTFGNKRPKLGVWFDTDKVAAMSQVVDWCRGAQELLERLEWQIVGYELVPDGSNNVDCNMPIFRCPVCWEYKDRFRPSSAPAPQHHISCGLDQKLQAYRSHLHSYLMDIATTATHPSADEDSSEEEPEGQPPPTVPSVTSVQTLMLPAPGIPPTYPFSAAYPTPTPCSCSSCPPTTSSALLPRPPDPLGFTPSNGLSILSDWNQPSALRQPSFGPECYFPSASLTREPSAPPRQMSNQMTDFEFFDNKLPKTAEENEEEEKVQHIMVTPSCAFGHPAFDSSQNLIGFYSGGKGQPSAENLNFVAFKRLPEDARTSPAMKEIRDTAAGMFRTPGGATPGSSSAHSPFFSSTPFPPPGWDPSAPSLSNFAAVAAATPAVSTSSTTTFSSTPSDLTSGTPMLVSRNVGSSLKEKVATLLQQLGKSEH